MDTYQIAPSVLDDYRNIKLTEERINFLIAQANEQLEEIAQNQEIYKSFLQEVEAPQKVDNIILWILLMSNEEIVEEYVDKFNKDYTDMIPVSDLADLLFYAVHLKKVKDVELDGFEYLMNYKEEGIQEMDHYSVTNALLFVRDQKESQMMQF